MESIETLRIPSHPTTKENVVESFRQRYQCEPDVLSRAPGRVNLLGAHVDSQEGWVLPGAIDRCVWLAAKRRQDRNLRLHALDIGESVELDMDALPPPRPERVGLDVSWADLPAGMCWSLERLGEAPCGLDAVFGGDIPIGAGVSSSAAVEMAFLLAWEKLGDFSLDDASRARLGRQTENGYLGVSSGVMDQLACLKGREQEVLLIDCRSLESEPIPMTPGLAILLVDSGERRRLAETGYNSRQQECTEALARLQRRFPRLRTLRDLTIDELESASGTLAPHLERRARHVVDECARVLAGAEALGRGDTRTLGEKMSESHRSSRDLFEASTPALDVLAETAWSHPGCYGARLSGGGFGGYVAALVDEVAIRTIGDEMLKALYRTSQTDASFFSCRLENGAGLVPLN